MRALGQGGSSPELALAGERVSEREGERRGSGPTALSHFDNRHYIVDRGEASRMTEEASIPRVRTTWASIESNPPSANNQAAGTTAASTSDTFT